MKKEAGKGDKPRPIQNFIEFGKEYDRIFKHNKEKDKTNGKRKSKSQSTDAAS